MEDLLLAILGAVKYFWDAIMTVVYFAKGVWQIFTIFFKPFVFLTDFFTSALPSIDSIQNATSTISSVSQSAQEFVAMVIPSWVYGGLYGLTVVAIVIASIKMFKKT